MPSLVAGEARGAALAGHRPIRPAWSNNNIYGSAHSNGFGMALCDGSVRTISYSIDLTTHGRLANRHDGNPVDQSKF